MGQNAENKLYIPYFYFQFMITDHFSEHFSQKTDYQSVWKPINVIMMMLYMGTWKVLVKESRRS